MTSERNLRVVIAALSLVGIAIATYLTIVDFINETPACVAGGKSCATVAKSPYSHLAGVPVSAWGLAGYALLLASAAARGEIARQAGFVLALTGFGFSAYLTYLELFVINATCQWCVASALVMGLLLIACTARLMAASPRSAPTPS